MTAVPLVAGMSIALLQAAPSGLAWWASTLANISTIVIAVALVILALVMVPSAFSAGRIYRRINGLIDRLHDDTTPILLHVRDITDNLNYISASIRDDVEGFKSTIQTTQARLNLAAETAERRMNDFNALLGVVQQEAERIFIDTASTIRGVRAGADSLQHPADADWDDELDEVSPSAASARGEPPRPEHAPRATTRNRRI